MTVDPGAETGPDPALKGALTRYRFMATVVGVLLVVLIPIGLPLKYFDGTGMWGILDSTPNLFAAGSSAQHAGEWITEYLGIAHGWLYAIFVVFAFLLSLKARWEPTFTIVTLVCGTIPIVSFWAEHRATSRVRAEFPEAVASGPSGVA